MENFQGASQFTSGEIISSTSISRQTEIPWSDGANILQIPEQMPYRLVGLYIEATFSTPALRNYYISGKLSFIKQGAKLAEMPVFVGHDGLQDPPGTPIVDVTTQTKVSLFRNEQSIARWTVLLSTRFMQSVVPITPMSLITPARGITWSIDDFKANPVAIAGFRLWVGVLSSSEPIS